MRSGFRAMGLLCKNKFRFDSAKYLTIQTYVTLYIKRNRKIKLLVLASKHSNHNKFRTERGFHLASLLNEKKFT